MKVTMRSLTSIRPYENNPRVNDQAVDLVANSIREFGFRQPIVVDEAGVIIVSHTRYKAALNNVGISVQRYTSCTGASAGRNECKREFNLLKSAADDFQDAVSDYRSDCK